MPTTLSRSQRWSKRRTSVRNSGMTKWFAVYMKAEGLTDKRQIKDDVWFEFYGQLVTKFENQFDVNEKLQKEILRRVERYNCNEKEYRDEIKLQMRELRVLHGYEKHAAITNRNTQQKYFNEIHEAVDGHLEHVK